MKENILPIDFYPLTASRWSDLEQLFGNHGANGGCWCIWWKLSSKDFYENKGEGNKTALKRLVDAGEFLGILAYLEGKAIGWCAFGPRQGYPRLKRSKLLAPVDERSVWSIVCFFVEKKYRKKGIMTGLIRAAIDFAAKQGAKIIEAYPIDLKTHKSPDDFLYTGLYSTFQKVGFSEIVRRSETRPIMRFMIE